jgi:hypothetical protein
MWIRRRFVRWKINKKAKIKFVDKEEFFDCQIIDLSLKGMQIALDERLPLNKVIKLNLFLSEDFILEIESWIIWQKVLDGHYFYGLYFTHIKDYDKEKIYQFVYKYFPQIISQQWYKESTEEGGENMQDRRIFVRFPVELPLRYLNLRMNHTGIAKTCDISAKGIGIFADEELMPNSPLEMWLKISNKDEPLYMRGEVVWSRMVEQNRYRIGIELEKAEFMNFSYLLKTI